MRYALATDSVLPPRCVNQPLSGKMTSPRWGTLWKATTARPPVHVLPYVSFIGENKIRPGLFSLLCLVRANPGICQIELGTHLGVDKASIVALLDRLERAGLIERKALHPRPPVGIT